MKRGTTGAAGRRGAIGARGAAGDPGALAQSESKARKGSRDVRVQLFSASRSTESRHTSRASTDS
jgi:hypothetical protein